jgi:hypothetical protein
LQGCILSTAGDPLIISGHAPHTQYVGLDDSYQIQNKRANYLHIYTHKHELLNNVKVRIN